MSLARARERRHEARKLLAEGVDPGQERKAAKAAAVAQGDTFELLAREWHQLFLSSWSQDHAAKILTSLENNAFPWIGHRPIRELLPPEILSVARRVEARGAVETAHRLVGTIGMHLPLDLPWAAGVERVAGVVLALRAKTAHLSPRRFVLHPPAEPEQLAALARLLAAGGLPPQDLLVENINGRDLALHWPVIQALDLGVCLDLGHMLVHGQHGFLTLPGMAARTRMLHLNAPDPERPSRHASLELLDAAGRDLCRRLLALLGPGGVVLLELFNAAALAGSRRALDSLLPAGAGDKEAYE